MHCTGGNVDALDVFAETVADSACDSKVEPGDHFDLLDGLAVLVEGLFLKGEAKIKIRSFKNLSLSLSLHIVLPGDSNMQSNELQDF